MGFHWQWFGVKRTGPGVVEQVLQAMGYEAREIRRNLTLEQVYQAEGEHDWGGVLGSSEFKDWTFLTGTALFDVADAAKIATAVGADACLAVAESTTWVLEMHYARTDGTTRSRSFTIVGADGKPPPIVLVMRKAGEGPLKRDAEGKEESEGTPLPGEPLDIQIADDERLCAVLSAVGFPVGELMNRYLGTFDWKAMESVPGPNANDMVFTAFIRGMPRQRATAQPRRKGFFGKLLGR